MSGIEITAADREAAANSLLTGWFIQHGGTMPWMFAQRDEVLAGCKDETEHVRAFAKHRIQARKDALEEALKICRAAQFSPHPHTDIKYGIEALLTTNQHKEG